MEMTRIRTYIFIVGLLFFGLVSAQSQQYRFLATGFSVMERQPDGEWGKWSDLKPAKITLVLDTNKDRIIVYSQDIQVYAILDYGKEEETDEDLIYPFSCTDDDGMPFTISIITRRKQGNRKQVYISQKDFVILYNVINYPDKEIDIK